MINNTREILVRVEAPHFVAGFICDVYGRILRCAPILRQTAFRYGNAALVIDYYRKKGYKVDQIKDKYNQN